jgi:hypothetical protein
MQASELSTSRQWPPRCSTCSAEIPRGARICTKCNQFQDWRGFFGRSSTVLSTILSLLVALFSVLTTAIPVIHNALTPERSNVQCSLLDWTDKNAKLVVSNKGVRPAVVQRAEVVLETPDGSKSSVILNPTESDPILEPGKYRVLIFSDPNLAYLPRLDKEFQTRTSLYLVIFPFAKEKGQIKCENWKKFHTH